MRPHTSRCSATSTCTRRSLSESRESRQSATIIHGRSSRPSRPSRSVRLDPAVERRPFATRCYALAESNLCPPMKDSSSHLSLQKTTAQTALHVAAASTILGEASRTTLPRSRGRSGAAPTRGGLANASATRPTKRDDTRLPKRQALSSHRGRRPGSATRQPSRPGCRATLWRARAHRFALRHWVPSPRDTLNSGCTDQGCSEAPPALTLQL